LAQSFLNRIPGFWLAQSSQQERQPVIGEVQLANLLPSDSFDGLAGLFHPGLNRLFAMIALGEDVCQPDGGNPAPTQALVQPVATQVMVEDVGQSWLEHDCQQ